MYFLEVLPAKYLTDCIDLQVKTNQEGIHRKARKTTSLVTRCEIVFHLCFLSFRGLPLPQPQLKDARLGASEVAIGSKKHL